MNYLIDKILRGTHRLYVDHYGQYLKPLDRISDPDEASDIIYQQLESDAPCMIARYGSVEILCVNNYLGIKKYEHIFGNTLRTNLLSFGGTMLESKICKIMQAFSH